MNLYRIFLEEKYSFFGIDEEEIKLLKDFEGWLLENKGYI